MDWLVDHFRLTMILLWGGTVVCAVAAFFVATFVDKPQVRTFLDLNIVPAQAKVLVDGVEFQRGMSVVEPGAKHIEISAEGFKSKTLDVKVEKDKTTSVSAYLLHETKGLSYYENDMAYIDALRSIKDDDAVSAFINNFDHKYSIYRKMPLTSNSVKDNGYYSDVRVVSGREEPGCKGLLCIKIISYKDGFGVASDLLKKLGYSINDYEVFYGSD